MADIQFLKGTASISNGSRNMTISGTNAAFVSIGTAIFVDGFTTPVEGIEGDLNTIKLRDPWPHASITNEPFVAFNTLEGLANAIRRLRDATGDSIGIANAFDDIITSTDPTITIELSTGPVTVTPFGYLEQQGLDLIQQLSQAADLFDDLQDDVAQLTQDVADQQSIVDTNLQASQAARDAAEGFATDASNSASAASTSETNASNSASAASTSETNAANSASAAATSETNASNSASAAATSESNASTSETNAANSASAAATSETNAANSATAAANSAQGVEDERILAEAARDLAEQYRDQGEDYSLLAAAYANYVGLWSSLSGSLDIPASVFHDGTFWQLLVNIVDVTASEPAVSNTDWQPIGATVTSVAGKTGDVTLAISDVGGLQTALNSKANTSSLAAVATSGAYSDLSGTPDLTDLDNATANATANTIVKRNAAGTFNVSTPTANNHPATKAYVDNEIGTDVAALQARIDEVEIFALAGL